MAVHIFRREATYYWRRRTPRSLAICLGRPHLFMSLRTTSPVMGRRLTTQLDAILEDAAMLAENAELDLVTVPNRDNARRCRRTAADQAAAGGSRCEKRVRF
jgi:hypothetical protein